MHDTWNIGVHAAETTTRARSATHESLVRTYEAKTESPFTSYGSVFVMMQFLITTLLQIYG